MRKASNRWDIKRYEESVAGLRSHLERQRLLSLALREYLDGNPTPVWKAPSHNISLLQVRAYQALLRAIETSASTVFRLTDNISDCVRDCFPIARSVVEAAINVGYIAAGGKTVAEEARQHSVHRCVLALDRRFDIGALSLRHRSRSLDQPETVPGLREVLAQMETEGDRKAYNWTPLSAPKRVEFILDRLGGRIALPLGLAYFGIYQDASEIVHGTIYGCFFSAGETIVDQEVALHDLAFTILFSCSQALNRAVASVGVAHKIDEIVERADSFDLLLLKIPVFAEAFFRSAPTA